MMRRASECTGTSASFTGTSGCRIGIYRILEECLRVRKTRTRKRKWRTRNTRKFFYVYAYAYLRVKHAKVHKLCCECMKKCQNVNEKEDRKEKVLSMF